MPIHLEIEKPRDFDFVSTVRGHGWYDLAPFRLDKERNALEYVFRDGRKAVARGTITAKDGSIIVRSESNDVSPQKIESDVHRLLRLDEDLSGFHAAAKGYEGTKWAVRAKAGRLLRSPTVFEDLIKTLCTTNCSWGLTRAMVTNLVEKLGDGGKRKGRAFPTPEAMAAKDEKFYREEIKAGYRSPFFVEIARRVANGEVDPETWLDPNIPTEDLRKAIKLVKGIGDYAADNLLKLLSRYDGLALDSWLRKKFFEKYNRGKLCKDKRIEKHYAAFGDWRALAIWCDMTEDWFE